MKKHSAFTLIELMVTIAVAGVLLAIAMPSFTAMVGNNRLATQSNEFVAALSFARAEAMKRGTAVTVCKSSNSSACATSGGWQSGWIIFNDLDRNGSVGSGEIVLRSKGAFGSSVNTMTGVGSVFVNRLTFTDQGMPDSTSGQLSGTFTVCDTGRNVARRIAVSVTGRTRVTQGACT